jgi:hypothetical protein
MVTLTINSPLDPEATIAGTNAYKQRQKHLSYCYMMAQGADHEAAWAFAEKHADSGRDITRLMSVRHAYREGEQ